MLDNLKISTKIHVLGGALLVLLALGSLAGVLSLRHAGALFSHYKEGAEQEMLIGRLSEDLLELRIAQLAYMDNPTAPAEGRVRGALADVLGMGADDPRLRDADVRRALEDVQQIARDYREGFDRAVAADPVARARLVEQTVAPLGARAAERLLTLHEEGLGPLNADGVAALGQMNRLEVAIFVAMALCICAGLTFALWMAGALSRPVERLRESVTRIAARDGVFTIPDTDRGDEVGHVARELAGLRDRLVQADRDEAERRRDDEAEKAAAAERRARYARMVESVRQALADLAGGDLTTRLPDIEASKVPEEYAAIRDGFNQAVGRVEEVIAGLRQSAASVQNGSGEIRQSAEDLSGRTESQGATLQELAASLDQLTRNVRATAENAGTAERTVQENREEAERTGAVVDEAVAAMNEIADSSDQITRIIGVIDDIAFQTNLLALNAGVEAARAGEAGKGFAVVASEVRTLAQRASDSAREIKQLISASSEKVAHGVDLVGRTGNALETIIDRVQRVADLVSEIARASREQATGLGEINDGINQLDKVTQQNVAQVEQSTAASAALDTEARRLLDYVERFRTDQQGGRSAALMPLQGDDKRQRKTETCQGGAKVRLAGEVVEMKPSDRTPRSGRKGVTVPAAGPTLGASGPVAPAAAGAGSGIWQDF